MRIVYLTRKFYRIHGYGGMEKYAWALARHLALLGDEVHVVTMPPIAGEVHELPIIDGIHLHYVHFPASKLINSGIQYFLYAYQAARMLQQIKPDIVQSFGIGAFFYLQKPVKCRRPVVMQSFGNEWFFHKGLRGMVRSPLKLALRNCMERCEAIAAETENQIAEITSLFGVPAERVFILPDGVEYASFLPKEEFIRDSSRKNGSFTLLNVNRLAPNKGVADFVSALDLLQKQNIPFRAIIIGSGPEEARILKMIQDFQLMPYVTHLQDVSEEDLVSQYSQADLFVCPTLQEGLPLVLLEALAAGLPVVATRAAQNETVIQDGYNGVLVPPHDPSAIAAGIKQLMHAESQDQKRLGENARHTAAAYDWRLIAAQARKQYQNLAESYSRY